MLKLSSDIFKDVYKIDSDGIIKFKVFLAGEWVESNRWFNVKSPIDLSIISKVSIPETADIDRSLEILYKYGRWDIRNMPGYKR
ncbi:MAG: NADP-dependent glyceraldehyde-3-phosphate dehydrogenase, partial [Thermoprotei archaeon]